MRTGATSLLGSRRLAAAARRLGGVLLLVAGMGGPAHAAARSGAIPAAVYVRLPRDSMLATSRFAWSQYPAGGPAPPLCVSSVPAAGPLSGRDRVAWRRAVQALQANEPGQALAALVGAGNHPALQAVEAVALARLTGANLDVGQAVSKIQERLVKAWPDDACLAYTSVFTLDQGRRAMEQRIDEVVRAEPDDPRPLVLRAHLLDSKAAAERDLDAVLKAHPDNAEARYLRATLLVASGRVDDALPDLEWWAAHAPDQWKALTETRFLDELVSALEQEGRAGDVVRMYARAGWPPLASARDLASAQDPMAAYRAWLGVGPGEDLKAVLHTGAGDLECTLEIDQVPLAVASFVALARGGVPWTDASGKARADSAYAGQRFAEVHQGDARVGDDKCKLGYSLPPESSGMPELKYGMAHGSTRGWRDGSQVGLRAWNQLVMRVNRGGCQLDVHVGRFGETVWDTPFAACKGANPFVKDLAARPMDPVHDWVPVDPVVLRSIDIHAETK